MAHHAYFIAGEREAAIEQALTYGREELGLSGAGNPDIIVFRHGLFSVEDARRIIRLVDQSPITGEVKLIVLAVERIFHEAQNALLKVFEEPSPGTVLILIVPSKGILIPTLRSRLVPLMQEAADISEEARTYLSVRGEAREKMVTKLLERTKSDKEEEKQAARGEVLRLIEGLLRAGYLEYKKGKPSPNLIAFLQDLERFVPILHERSAPYKLIFEHILLTTPKLSPG